MFNVIEWLITSRERERIEAMAREHDLRVLLREAGTMLKHNACYWHGDELRGEGADLVRRISTQLGYEL